MAINVRGGQSFIFVPYTGQTNDAGMLAWNGLLPADDQGPVRHALPRERREWSGHVPVSAPTQYGRPNAAKHLDEALRYILGHDGVWATTANDIAEYYLANYYDQVKSWIADRKDGVAE